MSIHALLLIIFALVGVYLITRGRKSQVSAPPVVAAPADPQLVPVAPVMLEVVAPIPIPVPVVPVAPAVAAPIPEPIAQPVFIPAPPAPATPLECTLTYERTPFTSVNLMTITAVCPGARAFSWHNNGGAQNPPDNVASAVLPWPQDGTVYYVTAGNGTEEVTVSVVVSAPVIAPVPSPDPAPAPAPDPAPPVVSPQEPSGPVPPNVTIIDITWPHDLWTWGASQTPEHYMGPGEVLAFRFTTPAEDLTSTIGLAYAGLVHCLSISETPGEITLALEASGHGLSGMNEPRITYSTIPGRGALIKRSTTYYANVKNAESPDGADTCPEGTDRDNTKFKLFW